MFRRIGTALLAAVMATTTLAVVGAVAPMPAAAAPAGLNLEMPGSGGELLIRDAEEAYALQSPTTVTGTIDDASGVISGASFSTPPISFQQPVLGGALTADIDATFTEVIPGTATGGLDPNGNLTLRTALKGDLHIEVPGAGIVADCTTSPVALVLGSATAYDPATGLVTVSDPDFTIPQVNESPTCQDPVRSAVNDSLAGSGHAITITLAGELSLPAAGTEQSVTTLEVDPADGAALGQNVTLTAVVAPGPDTEATDAPTGSVDFIDGTRVISRVPVTAGVATLTTSGLRLGAHSLRAEYRGDPVYLPSESETVSFAVAASPVVTAELPGYVTIGAPPTTFDLVTENPTVGSGVANARVDVTISRYVPDGGYSFDPLTPEDVVLEIETAPGTWEAVEFAQVPGTVTPTLTGSLGDLTGRPLAPGQSLTDQVRLSFPDGSPQTTPGPLDVELAVVAVDPGSGAINRELSSTTGRVNLFLPGRIESSIDFMDLFGETYGPATVRQGGTVGISIASVMPYFGGTSATGTFSALIDGHRVPLFGSIQGDLDAPTPYEIPLASGGAESPFIDLPADIGIGAHILTIVYSGDDQFTASSKSVPLTVVAPISAPYRCEYDNVGQWQRFNVQIRTSGRLPTSARAGSTVQLGDYSFEIAGNRYINELYSFLSVVDEDSFEGLTIDLGPAGTGSAPLAEMEDGADSHFGPEYVDDPDYSVTFTGEEASFPVTGAPGSVITPTLEGFTLSAESYGLEYEITCAPVGEPISYGSTTVAGTVLTVAGANPVRAEDEVDLTAAVYPTTATGTVRFFDGDTLLDIAAVVNGVATTSVTLPEGDHGLTARFLAGASGLSTTSEVVTVKVLPAVDCAASAVAGNTAVVRLTYLELLGRCPDAAGLAYWTGKLDDGVSPEAFARSIAYTREALGRVVDDGYQTIFGRDADSAGRAYWVGRLRANGRYEQLLADLAASNEFWRTAGSNNGGYVDLVYERVLGRSADPDGRGHWLTRLYFGEPRRVMVTTFARQAEPLGRIVDGSFDEILGRVPTGTERTAAVSQLRTDGDRSGLYTRLIGTTEFFNRAQGFPNPED